MFVPIIVNRYGKGNWIVSDLLISFVTKEEDIDQKHQLNFTNTTARFITKHHRDISDKVVHNRLLFFESDIDWIPKVEMFKQ
ncbi:hypothetical protein [uncultured Croceitalea sp.]|uniref:hypothetical protein n=1 Tax=uncultured Croceitalea sp. TaxID=1798908 RepID=UPI00374F73A4